MRQKKKSKKMIIIFSVVLGVAVIALFLCYIHINWWMIRPSDEIENIEIRLTLKDRYKDMTITDKGEIEHVREIAADVQKEFHIWEAKIYDAEVFQSDPLISMYFHYSDGRHQEFLVLKEGVAGGFAGPDYYWKYIRMDHVNTNELYNYFREDF